MSKIQLETAEEREERRQGHEVRVNQVRELEDVETWGEAAATLGGKIRRRAPATISRAPDADDDPDRAVAGLDRKKGDPPLATPHAEPEENQVLDLTVGMRSVDSPMNNPTELSLSPTRSLLAEGDLGPEMPARASGGKPKGMMAMVQDNEATGSGEDTPEVTPVQVRNVDNREREPVERIRLTKELRGKIIKIDEVSIQYTHVNGERRRASKRRRVYHVEFEEDFTYAT